MTKKKTKADRGVLVSLNLPPAVIHRLNVIQQRGLLGTTRDDVINHMLRQKLFDLEQEREATALGVSVREIK